MPIDPTEVSLISRGAKAVSESADGVLTRLLGPAADEIGEILRDKVRAYKARNLAKALKETERLVAESEMQVLAVSVKVLLPLIEGASLEDCDDLSKKWSSLLASAATATPDAPFHPSFPKILSEMTSLEAALLDKVFDLGGETPWISFRDQYAIDSGYSVELIRQAHGNLERLGIWHNIGRGSPWNNPVKLSEFGKAFVIAARGPSGRA